MSTGLPSPPQFPNILYAFRESLSVSKELRLLTRDIADRLDVNCACSVSASLNSTGYPQFYSRDYFSGLSCSGEHAVIGGDESELNSTEQLESAERMKQNGSKVAGLTTLITIVIILFVIVVAVVCLR